MHFELSDLRIFVAVAQSPSLTQGAKRAHLSVAATSARIKSLEGQLNARLLYRDSRGVTLTPAGETLLKHARLILRQVDYAKHEFAQQASGMVGHIRIFSNTTAITEFMPEVLARFLSDHPAVTVDLQERLSRDIVRGVLEGSADLGLIAGPVGAQEIDVIHYSTDRLLLAVPKGHPLASATDAQRSTPASTDATSDDEPKVRNPHGVSFTKTLNYPHIGLREGSTLYDLVTRQVSRLGKALPLRVQASSYEGICRMIEAGVGIGIIPESAAVRHQATMQFETVPLKDAWAIRERSILVRELDAVPECVRALVTAISASGNSASKQAD